MTPTNLKLISKISAYILTAQTGWVPKEWTFSPIHNSRIHKIQILKARFKVLKLLYTQSLFS